MECVWIWGLLFFTILIMQIVWVFQKNEKPPLLPPNLQCQTLCTLIILGSGGHIAELLHIVQALNLQRYAPRHYIASSNDDLSLPKAKIIESHMLKDFEFLNQVHRHTSSNVRNTAQPLGGLLLSDRRLWKSQQSALSDENDPSNDEADTELVEVTVLCAHNLKDLRCVGNMNPRAKLYIDNGSTVNTLIHFNGGKNPHWNYRFWFKIDEACFQIGHLSVEIYDWSCLGGNRIIGTARIPMSDLSDSHGAKEFSSYQVQVPRSGKFQGVVHVLVRRARKAMVQLADPFTDEPWNRYKAGCLEFPYPGM